MFYIKKILKREGIEETAPSGEGTKEARSVRRDAKKVGLLEKGAKEARVRNLGSTEVKK